MGESHSLVRNGRIVFALVFVLLLASSSAAAEVSLPALISQGMVVQRDLPVHVWGQATAGEAVTVNFRGADRTTKADELGRWSVHLPAGDAGGPFDLEIQGSNRIVVGDVWVGDVWVASGQSNMEMALREVDDAESEIASARFPGIRLLRVQHTTSDYPLTEASVKSGWQSCTPDSAGDFSAVAYFFGREIHQKERVPVGLIQSAWGGTPAESWTSLGSLSSDASLMPVFAQRSGMADTQAANLLALEKEEREYKKALVRAKAEGQPAPARAWHPDFDAWAPAALYNAMISPLTRLPIRGVIWYQGESNTGPEKGPLYARLFQTLIEDWREAWGQGELPFLYVQIANWDPGEDWPIVREGQRAALTLRNTGMAVSIDIGDPVNIHPRDKQDVGHRLALAARAIAYGEDVEYSGPLFRLVTSEEEALRVWFDHATGGLKAKGDALKGFEIAGADQVFAPAAARIDGATVVVSMAKITRPVFVRYGWTANPDCNLYNGEGLPASPFRSGPAR
jgi:sialate O-acetylesterase